MEKKDEMPETPETAVTTKPFIVQNPLSPQEPWVFTGWLAHPDLQRELELLNRKAGHDYSSGPRVEKLLLEKDKAEGKAKKKLKKKTKRELKGESNGESQHRGEGVV